MALKGASLEHEGASRAGSLGARRRARGSSRSAGRSTPRRDLLQHAADHGLDQPRSGQAFQHHEPTIQQTSSQSHFATPTTSSARLRRLPGPAGGDREVVDEALATRLPAHRHGRRLPQRGGRRPGGPRLGPRARGGVRHDEVLQRRSRLRAGHAGVSSEPGAAGDGLRRPLPDPLAGARDDRYVETWRAFIDLQAGARPLDRRLELQPRAPRARDRTRPA